MREDIAKIKTPSFIWKGLSKKLNLFFTSWALKQCLYKNCQVICFSLSQHDIVIVFLVLSWASACFEFHSLFALSQSM